VTIHHPPILGSCSLEWPDEAACARTASALAGVMRAGPQPVDLAIELHGPLGAGKTTFARHLLRALGVAGRIKSPTFAVMEPHELPGLPISHFDFYRLDDPREWLDAGFRETLAAPGLKLIEWADKAAGLLPAADLNLLIAPGDDDGRSVTLTAGTVAGRVVLDAMNRGPVGEPGLPPDRPEGAPR
jgi:tRNA threonylcarbamoyladenosine biosynthesis protein TsaE